MDADEVQHIQKLHDAESKEYMYGIKIVLRFAVILPIVAGLLGYFYLPRLAYMLQVYAIAQLLTALIFLLFGVGNYFRSLYALKKDLDKKEKTIEIVSIQRKKYMPRTQTFHFYISSDVKYSIEVSAQDFEQYDAEDELSIEYSKYAKVYLGYF